MNKKTLTILESILEDDAILSTMTAEQQAALEEVFGDYHFQEAWKEDYQKFLEDLISDAKGILKSIKPKKQKKPKPPSDPKNSIIVGLFYKTPEGIVRTYSFSQDGVGYYDRDGVIGKTNNFEGWVRKDLVEFPHTWNPRLPYEFDLMWDIKHCSELLFELQKIYAEETFDMENELCDKEFPPVRELIDDCYNIDLHDIIKATTLYNQPLEQIMTKFEAAQKLGLKVFDYALPQQWIDEQEAKHGESPVPYFVWGYDNNKIFGEPICLIPGKEYLSK